MSPEKTFLSRVEKRVFKTCWRIEPFKETAALEESTRTLEGRLDMIQEQRLSTTFRSLSEERKKIEILETFWRKALNQGFLLGGSIVSVAGFTAGSDTPMKIAVSAWAFAQVINTLYGLNRHAEAAIEVCEKVQEILKQNAPSGNLSRKR